MPHPSIQRGELTYGLAPRGPDPDALVRQHREMVRRIAWHVFAATSSKIELEDLVQIGLVALIEAARNFEERGVGFAAYAATRVRGEMIDHLRREAWVSRAGMRNRRTLAQARSRLEAAFGRGVTDAEMAGGLNLSADDYHNMVASAQTVEQASIDEVYSDDQPWFADLGESVETRIEREQLAAGLSRAISELPEREAMILQLYFVEEMNLNEIGAVLDIGAARVCQIKKAALQKLRARMETDD